MAYMIPTSTTEALRQPAAALFELAGDTMHGSAEAPRAGPDDLDAAEHINTLVCALQALIAAAPLTGGGVCVALGAVVGAVIAQCEGKRQEAWDIVRTQTTASLAEVAAAREPQGRA